MANTNDKGHTELPYYSQGGTVYNADPAMSANRVRQFVVCYTADDMIDRESAECVANAEFIVRAVNNHYKLVDNIRKRRRKLISLTMQISGNDSFNAEVQTEILELDNLLQAATEGA